MTVKENEVKISQRLAVGTAQFGSKYGIANQLGQVSRTEINKILESCAKNKITFIDTAVAYGESEATLGSLMVNNYNIVTKLTRIPDNHPNVEDFVVNQVKQSLSKLKVSKLYALLLHHSDQLFGAKGVQIYNALKKLKDIGYTTKIGVSVYDPSIIKEVMCLYDIDIVQVPLNLIDRRLTVNNFHKYLKDKDIEVHVRSIFLQGLLLLKKDQRPAYFRRWDVIWDKWHSWLIESSLNPIDACIQFGLSYQEVDKIVIGVDNHEQLNDIIYSANENYNLSFPETCSDDQFLINPSKWPTDKI